MFSHSLKFCNNFMKIGFSIFALYKIVLGLHLEKYDRIASTACVFLVVLVPFIIRKVIRYNLSDKLEFIYLIFVFLAHILGTVVNLYSSVWWWDLFVHFLSGVFTSYIALILLTEFKVLKSKNKIFSAIFIVCFSLSIASLWEFFEFTADKITGGDTQWVLKTGVDDTMTDMLVAFLGSILFAFNHLINKKSNF